MKFASSSISSWHAERQAEGLSHREVIIMNRFHREIGKLGLAIATCLFAGGAIAQTRTVDSVRHVGFDTPDGWALKYFTSATLLNGLQPPEPLGEHPQLGAVTVGVEFGWVPSLRPSQAASVGFRGPKLDDLNRAPIMERPIIRRKQWTLGWRASGQVGSVKGDFTCPQRTVGFAAGSSDNPAGCVTASADVASLRYFGTEVQFAYRIPRFPKLIPHVAEGINYIDDMFHVDSQYRNTVDHTQLWTRGKTSTSTAGVSYLFTDKMALTVDAFYSPLRVQRDPLRPSSIDGLFNVRALVSYRFR